MLGMRINSTTPITFYSIFYRKSYIRKILKVIDPYSLCIGPSLTLTENKSVVFFLEICYSDLNRSNSVMHEFQ